MSCAPATSPILAPMGRYIFKNRSILQLLRISVFSYICVNQRNQYIQYDNMNININAYENIYIYIYQYHILYQCTAQGGGGSFKDRKPIGELLGIMDGRANPLMDRQVVGGSAA